MAAPPAPRPAPEVQRMKTDAAGGAERSLYLPDFCTSRAALVLILIVELTALVLTLARQSLEGDFWADLSRTSLADVLAGTGHAAVPELEPHRRRGGSECGCEQRPECGCDGCDGGVGTHDSILHRNAADSSSCCDRGITCVLLSSIERPPNYQIAQETDAQKWAQRRDV